MEGDQYLASFNFPLMERKPKVAGLAVLLGEVSELELQKSVLTVLCVMRLINSRSKTIFHLCEWNARGYTVAFISLTE